MLQRQWPPDGAAVIRLAEAQRGVVIRRQLRSLGVSPSVEARMVATGWLRQIRPRAYAIAGRSPSGWDDAVAASFLAGPGAALSHATAAAIHGLPGLAAPTVPELSVPLPRHPRVAGVVLHRVGCLDPPDIDRRGGVVLTSRVRTVCDLANRLNPALLARVVDEGCVSGWWTPEELADCVNRTGRRGRPGSQTLSDVLRMRTGEPAVESMLELRAVRALAPFGPFVTQFQLVLEGEVLVLDIAWPAWKVGVEVDGWSVRSKSFGKFTHGRHRDNLLLAHGWRVAHLTAAMDDTTMRRDVLRLFPPEISRVLAAMPVSDGRR